MLIMLDSQELLEQIYSNIRVLSFFVHCLRNTKNNGIKLNLFQFPTDVIASA